MATLNSSFDITIYLVIQLFFNSRRERGEAQGTGRAHLLTSPLLHTGRATPGPASPQSCLSPGLQWADSVSASEEAAAVQHAANHGTGRDL